MPSREGSGVVNRAQSHSIRVLPRELRNLSSCPGRNVDSSNSTEERGCGTERAGAPELSTLILWGRDRSSRFLWSSR
jgi:hypothetical protein